MKAVRDAGSVTPPLTVTVSPEALASPESRSPAEETSLPAARVWALDVHTSPNCRPHFVQPFVASLKCNKLKSLYLLDENEHLSDVILNRFTGPN